MMTLAAKTVLDVIRILNQGLQYDDAEQQKQSVTLARQTLLDELRPTDEAYEAVAEAADNAQAAMNEAATEDERLDALVEFRDTVESLENTIQS